MDGVGTWYRHGLLSVDRLLVYFSFFPLGEGTRARSDDEALLPTDFGLWC